jgi:hypothetical protein
LADLGACLRGYGYRPGQPNAKNLSRGRASFGFKGGVLRPPGTPENFWRTPAGRRYAKRFNQRGDICAKRVHLSKRLNKIIAKDRAKGPGI